MYAEISFHEFYNFLLFNFNFLLCLEDFFLPTTFTHTHTHDPHPRPTTSTHYPRPTAISYTPDCTGRVGEAIKRKGGVSQACLGKSTSFIYDIYNMVN